jgi:phage tail sheath gpL-like
MVKKPSQMILGYNGLQATATSRARTTLNHELFSLLYAQDAETPSDEMAAVHAFARVLTERNAPGGWNSSFSGTVLPGVRLARDVAKLATDHNVQKTMLQNGISPVSQNANGEAVVVKAITTRCQATDGSDDYGALDVAEPTVTYEIQERKARIWSDYRSRNKHVRDDFASNEATVPNVATPSGYSRFLVQQLTPLVGERVFESAPTAASAYNRTTKRIQTTLQFRRLQLNEQGEGVVRGLV